MKLIINAKKIYSNILKQGKMRFILCAKKPTSGFEVPTGSEKVPASNPFSKLQIIIFSPNSRSIVVTSRDYIDSKSAMDVAIDELFSIASVDWPPDELYQVVMEIVTHLKNKIDAGRRKRKISESQSVDSSRR